MSGRINNVHTNLIDLLVGLLMTTLIITCLCQGCSNAKSLKVIEKSMERIANDN